MLIRPKSKCLVYSSVGDERNISFWENTDRNYDICLAYYGTGEFPDQGKVEYFLQNRDYKIPNFLKCVERFPEIKEYDYYFFLDDDLEISNKIIRATIEKIEKYSLALCQPSIAQNSATISWPHLSHKPGLLIQYVNFVEIQAPCFSRELLLKSLPYFPLFSTGCGVDILWSKLLKGQRDKIAVFHDLQFFHPKPRPRKSVREIPEFKQMNKQILNRLSAALGENDVFLGFRPEIYKSLFSNKLVYYGYCLLGRKIWRFIEKIIESNNLFV